ncbi:hypothetical protein [Eubacterium sp.]|uniref:hypothetical protein n=1 Tax=Eubacterium sp. TaxID=142586 RepID=UPI0026DFD813|nr:hypothetical protein [Eubacterium sp.]MDO5433337.1 hypothetical protein [Eubacterium sp.]
MIGLILVTIIFLISLMGIILAAKGKIKYTKKNSRAIGVATALAILAIAYYVASCGLYLQMSIKTIQYQEKKTYIEAYTQKNGRSLNDTLDQVALQVIKEQQNEWRIEAQTNYKLLGSWIVLPKEVMVLEEIR